MRYCFAKDKKRSYIKKNNQKRSETFAKSCLRSRFKKQKNNYSYFYEFIYLYTGMYKRHPFPVDKFIEFISFPEIPKSHTLIKSL